MKRVFFKAIFLIALTFLCLETNGYATTKTPADTVIINFGNQSKIVIYVNESSDLDALSNYDINQMLKDLKIKIEEADGEVSYLKIEDEEGDHYLKDTTIVFNEEQEEITIDSVADADGGNIHKSIVIKAPGFKTKEKTRNKHSINVELGLNNYLKDGDFSGTNAEDYGVKPFGSWYVGITSKRKSQISGPLFLEWGGGISWYNFKLEDPQVRILKGEDGVLFQEADASINGQKSKLTASFINVSIVPVLDFSQGRRKESLSISEGPVKITKYNKQGFRFGIALM